MHVHKPFWLVGLANLTVEQSTVSEEQLRRAMIARKTMHGTSLISVGFFVELRN